MKFILLFLIFLCSNVHATSTLNSNVSASGSITIQPRQLSVMFIGDSLTLGTGSTPWGFREKFQINVQTWRFNYVGIAQNPASDGTYDVDHSGVSGDDSEGVEARILGEITTHNPDIIIMMIGTNPDFPDVTPTTEQSMTDIAGIVFGYNPNIKLYVATPPPCPARGTYCDTISVSIATRIHTLQGTYPNLFLINSSLAALADDFNLCSGDFATNCVADATHPNASGYQELANIFSASILDCAGYSRCDVP